MIAFGDTVFQVRFFLSGFQWERIILHSLIKACPIVLFEHLIKGQYSFFKLYILNFDHLAEVR